MAAPTTARTRVRVSKNKKKNWRKYSDIKDVENYLEEQRFLERIGGPISDKPEELFFVDTKQQEVTFKKKNKSSGALKCHQGIGSYSKVQTPVNPLQIVGKKQTARLLASKEKKLKQLTKKPLKLKKKPKVPEQKFHDLWAEDVTKKIDPEIQRLIDYRDEITKKRPVNVPCHRYQKPSLLPAVEVPHPGASYNPSYEDHQELLRDAVVIEQAKVKEELHLKRVLDDMFPTRADAPNEKTWLAEMSQGLSEAEEENDPEIDEFALLSCNPPVTAELQKSKSQKRKIKEQRQLKQQQLSEKQTKHEMNQVFRVRTLLSELKKEEKRSKEKQLKKEKLKAEKMYQPRTIGKYKYEPMDLEVNLSEQVNGSMRELKVEGNILEDRYKSFQRRNIIEPRIRQKRKRKYKLKVQVKRSHRNFK